MTSTAAPVVTSERPVTVLDRTDRESLLATCRRALDQARRSQRLVLVSWAKPLTLADPVAIWSRARRGTPRSFLWQSAWDRGSVVAIGSARDLRGRGENRVASVRDGWQALTRDLVTGGTAVTELPAGEGPLAIGGFAFSPENAPEKGRLPDALMWVPALQIRGTVPDQDAADRPGPAELRLNAVLLHDSDAEQVVNGLIHLADLCLPPEAAAEGRKLAYADERTHTSAELPDADRWKGLVRRATGRIRDGDFEKVVLARELRVTASSPFDVPTAVHRLRSAYPGTTVFAVDHEEYTFLGATPEYLVRVDHRAVHALGLAGTAPRGLTPEQDAALALELAGSAKIQHEHDVVVQMLRDALRDSCVNVDSDAEPSVVKLANVQHLSTKVRGELAADSTAGILDFVDRLHPTPALGGHPRKESLSWLSDNEGLDRSWYAGVVGWADHSGQGQFAVTIRSALVDGPSASLYAGCGIVADSDPEAEYAESCAKLRPMMSALGIE
ncbi:isochorismate synthase [Streptomyces sp. RKAG337]|uniref:isochorismate synthase n=1 Tax=Streptomyces sp. RKAG337 TaxID=2893404 RepID=UPI0020336DED|nr:isochorismate synthase [Streptomyces sp. RKAG337]MCM2426023.1 isochorismate synthase [Streptomyces sp. RKAG337]